MKVLHLMVSGRAGGIESLLRDYVNYSRHENLFLFAWAGGPAAEQIEKSGCRIIVMDKEKQGSRAVCRRILEVCEQERVDAVVVHHEAPLLRISALLAKRRSRSIRVFCYAHSDAHFLCGTGKKVGLTVKKQVFRYTFRKADKAVAISNAVKDSLMDYLGVPEQHIAVIYNGAVLERFHPVSCRRDGPLRLIYVGRLIEEKGVQTILKTLSGLSDVDYHFTVVGDGDYREPLQALAKELGIGSKVDFLGTRSDVPELLADADVFVHLPECAEGFGIAVVEAMASGLLCVCGDRGALPEIVEDGVSGIIVKNSAPDALAEILRAISRDPKKWQTLRENAVKAAQKFSIEVFAAKLDDLLEEA
ncbi:MAG: glycosyltransferase family 4 protein [Eubacteriales bacterium]|nr:glycosyltransferase family 4 protein [Eubacteriales bacterium]